jgi:hypothetical protein
MEARKHLHPGQHNRFKGGWLAVKKNNRLPLVGAVIFCA